jgi:hypothetical protein
MPTTLLQEIEAYQFHELSDKAKDAVRLKLTPSHDWWDHIYDAAIEEGKELGFEIEKINFSGFYAQGDGACWQGAVNMRVWLERNRPVDTHAHIALALIEDGWVNRRLCISTRSNHYSHSNTMNHDGLELVEPEDDSRIHTKGLFEGSNVRELFDTIGCGYWDSIAVDMLADARDYADTIYKRLRDDYEWLMSDEYLTEMCEANEYLFDAEGSFI